MINKCLPLALLIILVFSLKNLHSNPYFNSLEPGCDGSDPTVLFCDDFEDGNWSDTHCDDPDQSGNDGWCMNIYAPWPDPQGTGWGRCGGKGAGGTNCAATSGFLDAGAPYPNGGASSKMMGNHKFAPSGQSEPEVYIRFYFKQLPGFDMGHEKTMHLYSSDGQNCCIMNKRFGSGDLGLQLLHKDQGWLSQNQGNSLIIQNNKWYYFEMHLKMNSATNVADGVYELWMDDCGTDGLGCTGPGTLRAQHLSVELSNAGVKFTNAWMENWGNPGSTGEQYYDQFIAATRRIGPMLMGPDPTPPTISITAPSAGSTVSGSISVDANASDSVGVASVQFRLDGVNIGSPDAASPYTIIWNTLSTSGGVHTLTAIATDSSGNSATSSGVLITVDNSNLRPAKPTGLRFR